MFLWVPPIRGSCPSLISSSAAATFCTESSLQGSHLSGAPHSRSSAAGPRARLRPRPAFPLSGSPRTRPCLTVCPAQSAVRCLARASVPRLRRAERAPRPPCPPAGGASRGVRSQGICDRPSPRSRPLCVSRAPDPSHCSAERTHHGEIIRTHRLACVTSAPPCPQPIRLYRSVSSVSAAGSVSFPCVSILPPRLPCLCLCLFPRLIRLHRPSLFTKSILVNRSARSN